MCVEDQYFHDLTKHAFHFSRFSGWKKKKLWPKTEMLFILGWFSLLLSKINCVSVWLMKRIVRNLCRYLFYGYLSFKQIELTAIYRMRSFLFVLIFRCFFFHSFSEGRENWLMCVSAAVSLVVVMVMVRKIYRFETLIFVSFAWICLKTIVFGFLFGPFEQALFLFHFVA